MASEPATLAAAREKLLEDGYCVVDGQLPDGALERLRRWSDDWIARTEHPPQWRYQGSDIKLSGIRTRRQRRSSSPGTRSWTS